MIFLLISADEEILSGTPVMKGTRILIYGVAASVAAGYPMERVLGTLLRGPR